MKIAVYSTKNYEKSFLDNANSARHELHYFPETLSLDSVHLSNGYSGICCFVSDCLNQSVIEKLRDCNVRFIALRSAGYDHVDLSAAKKNNIVVSRAPKYSPQAIAEFSVGLMLALNRKILKSYQQGLEYNFSLEGLIGFNLYQKTIGIVGTGHIGAALAEIMRGFSCTLLAYDPFPNEHCKSIGVKYVTLKELLNNSDIVSLHCPLNNETHHLINETTLSDMKKSAILINTGRGALVDTRALINALKSEQLQFAGLDVYENERGLFFIDHRGKDVKKDPLFSELQSLPNVLITPHQAFLTQEAMEGISKTTIENITAFEQGSPINII